MTESVQNHQGSAIHVNQSLGSNKKIHDYLLPFSNSPLEIHFSLVIRELLRLFFHFIFSVKCFTFFYGNSQRNLFLTNGFHQWSP